MLGVRCFRSGGRKVRCGKIWRGARGGGGARVGSCLRRNKNFFCSTIWACTVGSCLRRNKNFFCSTIRPSTVGSCLGRSKNFFRTTIRPSTAGFCRRRPLHNYRLCPSHYPNHPHLNLPPSRGKRFSGTREAVLQRSACAGTRTSSAPPYAHQPWVSAWAGTGIG